MDVSTLLFSIMLKKNDIALVLTFNRKVVGLEFGNLWGGIGLENPLCVFQDDTTIFIVSRSLASKVVVTHRLL